MFSPLKSPAFAIVLLCGISTAHAQERAWKHGILEAKSDAGFIAMVDKGGFAAKRGLKLELLQIKAGATLMKALLSGEIERGHGRGRVDCGWCARYRHQDSRLHLAGRAAGCSCQG